MKLTFLAWFFFILYGHALSNMVLEDSPTSKHEDLNLSKLIMHGQVHGLNGTIGLYGEADRRGYKGKHEIFHSIKGRRGRGSGSGGGGGANDIVHRPDRREKSAAASIFLSKPSSVPATKLYVSLAFIRLFPFLLL